MKKHIILYIPLLFLSACFFGSDKLDDLFYKLASLSTVEIDNKQFNVNEWSKVESVFTNLSWSEAKPTESGEYPIIKYATSDKYLFTVKGAHAGIFSSELSIKYPNDGNEIELLIQSNKLPITEKICKNSENLLYLERYYTFNFNKLNPIKAKYSKSSGSGGTTETIEFSNNIQLPDLTVTDSEWTKSCDGNKNNNTANNSPPIDAKSKNLDTKSNVSEFNDSQTPLEIDSKNIGKIKNEAEIKGIKIGMQFTDVKKLINSYSGSKNKCTELVVHIDDMYYEVADFIYQCTNFKYFGQESLTTAYFIDGKLNVFTVGGEFESESMNKDDFAELPRALMEHKYGVPPKMTDHLGPSYDFDNKGKYEYEWEDPIGNKLIFFTDYQRYMTQQSAMNKPVNQSGVLDGCSFYSGMLKLFSKDFEKLKDDRYKLKQAKNQQRAISADNKKKKDL